MADAHRREGPFPRDEGGRGARSLAFAFACALVVWLVAGPGLAEDAYGVGDRIEPIALEDQHGDAGGIDAGTRVVLFSRDMDGGDLLKAALSDVEEDFLPSRGAVYVSDISGMPRMVARLFAVPAMRRRPYRMLLDREGVATVRLPDEAGRATLIFLDGLVVRAIEHAGTSEDVTRILERAAAN